MTPHLLILSAPSGAGKTTLAKRILELLPKARLSVSMTTRPPRGQEQHGREYHFVSEEEFRRAAGAGELLEWAEVHGNLYGTPRGVLAAGSTDEWVLFDIDVQGGNALRRQFPGAVTVLVLPPSMEVLEQRLRSRATDSEAAIARRIAASRAEIATGQATYGYAVVNTDLEEAARDVIAIARAELLRIRR